MQINHCLHRRMDKLNDTNKHMNNKEQEDKKRTTSRIFFSSLFLMVIQMVKWSFRMQRHHFYLYKFFSSIVCQSFVLEV
jgi:hypothetical protein